MAGSSDWVVEQQPDGGFDIYEGRARCFTDADDLNEVDDLLTNWRVDHYTLVDLSGYRHHRRVYDGPV